MVGKVNGNYTYTSWRKGEKEETSFDILEWNNSCIEKDDAVSLGQPPTFVGHGSDLIADFEILGCLHGRNQVTWAKLYNNEGQGWLYSGELDDNSLSIVGSWGRNAQLWHGTFLVKKEQAL